MNAHAGRREIKSYRWWTQEEDDLLRQMFPTASVQQMRDTFGRCHASIYRRAELLGVKRSAEFKLQAKESQSERIVEIGKAHRLRKGNIPWNKGKAGWKAGGRSVDTQFKPGHKPSNTWRPVGAERVSKDGILYRKVSDTGDKKQDWRAVHVLIWEAENGPLPDGWVVVFKDKDRQNFAPDNLLALSKQDHMRRNSITRYPREVHAMAVKIGRFVGKLKKLEKDVRDFL